MLLLLKQDKVSNINPKPTVCVWPCVSKPQCNGSQGVRHRSSVQLSIMPGWIFGIVIAIFCDQAQLVLTMSSPAVHWGMMCFMLLQSQ